MKPYPKGKVKPEPKTSKVKKEMSKRIWYIGLAFFLLLIVSVGFILPAADHKYDGLPQYTHIQTEVEDSIDNEYKGLDPTPVSEQKNDTRGEYYESRNYTYLGWYTQELAKNVAGNYDDSKYYNYYGQWRVWIK